MRFTVYLLLLSAYFVWPRAVWYRFKETWNMLGRRPGDPIVWNFIQCNAESLSISCWCRRREEYFRDWGSDRSFIKTVHKHVVAPAATWLSMGVISLAAWLFSGLGAAIVLMLIAHAIAGTYRFAGDGYLESIVVYGRPRQDLRILGWLHDRLARRRNVQVDLSPRLVPPAYRPYTDQVRIHAANRAALVDAPAGGYTHEDYMEAARAFLQDGETDALQLLLDAGVVTLQELKPQNSQRRSSWDWSESLTQASDYYI